MSRTTAFVLIAYAFLVTMLGATLPTPLYPIMAQRYSFGALMVTVIFAVYAFGVLAGLLAFGELSDAIGRKPVLVVGLVLSAISSVLFVVADSLTTILAGRAVSGLSAALFTGTATAMLVDLAPDGRRRFASLVAVLVNLGGLGLGALISGLLADYFGSPLRVPFVLHVGLLVPALLGALLVPESVPARRLRLRLQRLSVPDEVRGVFIRGAAAGLASFAVAGVLSSVAPAFLAQVLGRTSHTLAGLLVFILMGCSIGGQIVVGRLSDRRALVWACVLLLAGSGLLASALVAESLSMLIVSTVVAGIGLGLGVGAGLAAINQRAPADRRAETASSFFVVLYVGLSVPVIGTGLAAHSVGLRTAGIAFSVAVGAVVLGVLASLVRVRN